MCTSLHFFKSLHFCLKKRLNFSIDPLSNRSEALITRSPRIRHKPVEGLYQAKWVSISWLSGCSDGLDGEGSQENMGCPEHVILFCASYWTWFTPLYTNDNQVLTDISMTSFLKRKRKLLSHYTMILFLQMSRYMKVSWLFPQIPLPLLQWPG